MTTLNRFWLISAILVCINLILGALYLFRPTPQQLDPDILGVNDAIPVFNKSYVMDNETFKSTRVFSSEQSIQTYLNNTNSPLKSYKDNGQLASTLIWNASRGITSSKWGVTPQLNPGVLIGYLEKEQSLISLTNYDTVKDPQNRIRTAMGYGCPDFAKCDTSYYGLSNQLNWAAYQLQYNFNRAGNSTSNTQYKKNLTVTTLDGYNVFLGNEATAAQYAYTPHVYWGNYNLWKIITANGWGVSAQTYNMREIDQVNIYNKSIDPDQSIEQITKQQVANIINAEIAIGTQSKDIETLQKFLRQEGYYSYAFITGYYGTITKQAHELYKLEKASAPVASTPIVAPKPTPEPVSNVVPTPKPVTKTAPSCDELYQKEYAIGEISDTVKALQECLRNTGDFTYGVNTGYYGPVTEEAQVKYLNRLKQQKATKVETNCAVLRDKTWNTGQEGPEVTKLQECLRAAGFFNWPYGNSGYYGPVTNDALVKWKASLTPKNRCEVLRDQKWTFGQRSNEVQELQTCLKAKGFFNWPYITDYFGAVTNEALNKYRQTNAPIFECSDLKKQEWVLNENSERVRQLQDCMKAAGKFSFNGGSTGYFGNATKNALIAWRGYF
jgi:peptidoglycan hydrolase-like protein with peptidoglycan-binding domain